MFLHTYVDRFESKFIIFARTELYGLSFMNIVKKSDYLTPFMVIPGPSTQVYLNIF